MNEHVAAPDVACTLNDEEFKERRALVRKTILAHVSGRQRRPTGIKLDFVDAPNVRAHVENFVALERQCCGFLTFTMSPPEEGLTLFIEAPDAGQDTLDRLAAAVSAND